uniref:NYN domain-containing protein n=1 Tax=Brassica oleracea var. oleracea TaxID=109376 RepID=A0A0D3DV07_BRAOL
MASYSEPYVSNGTGVFWDMDECKIPEGRTEADLVPFIREMLLGVGLRGEKREKMTKILEDIVSWSGENPEPSLGILVLGHLGAADDADITEVTELLKTQKNYHFVFATPGSPPPPTVVRFLRAIPRGGL